MNQSTNPHIPDEAVATEIIERFVARGLIPADVAAPLAARLISGRMTAGEWRLLAERAIQDERNRYGNE